MKNNKKKSVRASLTFLAPDWPNPSDPNASIPLGHLARIMFCILYRIFNRLPIFIYKHFQLKCSKAVIKSQFFLILSSHFLPWKPPSLSLFLSISLSLSFSEKYLYRIMPTCMIYTWVASFVSLGQLVGHVVCHPRLVVGPLSIVIHFVRAQLKHRLMPQHMLRLCSSLIGWQWSRAARERERERAFMEVFATEAFL